MNPICNFVGCDKETKQSIGFMRYCFDHWLILGNLYSRYKTCQKKNECAQEAILRKEFSDSMKTGQDIGHAYAQKAAEISGETQTKWGEVTVERTPPEIWGSSNNNIDFNEWGDAMIAIKNKQKKKKKIFLVTKEKNKKK